MAPDGLWGIQNSGGEKLMLKSIIDTILGPAVAFLQFSLDKLATVSLVADRGLNLDYFLGSVAGLGDNWITLIKSLTASILLLGIVFIAKSAYNAYLNAKSGVKWW